MRNKCVASYWFIYVDDQRAMFRAYVIPEKSKGRQRQRHLRRGKMRLQRFRNQLLIEVRNWKRKLNTGYGTP